MIYLTLCRQDKTSDVSAYTGNYQLSDNIKGLGAELSFDFMANSLDVNYAGKEPAIGDKVIFKDSDTVVFTGIIASVTHNDLAKFSYKAYDYGFYLNKSEAVIQYNNVTVDKAISQLCSENSIPVASICPISTVVSKMYDTKPISDIIKDLLSMATDELGIKYRLEMLENKLHIAKHEELIVDAFYKPAKDVRGFNPADIVGAFSKSQSIEDMKTRVIIISSKEKHTQIEAQTEDSNNINRFGLLTKVEKVDDKQLAQAKQIAQNKLNELNKVKSTFTLTLFGDNKVRSGRSLKFNQPLIGLVGTFLIVNCTHKYSNNAHTMDLELEV